MTPWGLRRRKPDFIIGTADDPYLKRWYIAPRNSAFNIYLHKIIRSDDDRANHSHPWLFNISFILKGGYLEHTKRRIDWISPGSIKIRLGMAFHRLEIWDGSPCWTLFITGPRIREWYFDCPRRLVPWYEFTAPTENGNSIGRGCD